MCPIVRGTDWYHRQSTEVGKENFKEHIMVALCLQTGLNLVSKRVIPAPVRRKQKGIMGKMSRTTEV
jgi:hypothetical protein